MCTCTLGDVCRIKGGVFISHCNAPPSLGYKRKGGSLVKGLPILSQEGIPLRSKVWQSCIFLLLSFRVWQLSSSSFFWVFFLGWNFRVSPSSYLSSWLGFCSIQSSYALRVSICSSVSCASPHLRRRARVLPDWRLGGRQLLRFGKKARLQCQASTRVGKPLLYLFGTRPARNWRCNFVVLYIHS